MFRFEMSIIYDLYIFVIKSDVSLVKLLSTLIADEDFNLLFG